MNTYSLINDNQSLVSVKDRFENPLNIYDDGYGPLFIHRDSMGISGIVRARTWQDAYSICEDEFFPDCDLTHEELLKEYGFSVVYERVIDKEGNFLRWDRLETPSDDYYDNPIFQENYGFRPNGQRSGSDNPMGHIYSKDLNGDSLDLLTPELVEQLGLTVEGAECE